MSNLIFKSTMPMPIHSHLRQNCPSS